MGLLASDALPSVVALIGKVTVLPTCAASILSLTSERPDSAPMNSTPADTSAITTPAVPMRRRKVRPFLSTSATATRVMTQLSIFTATSPCVAWLLGIPRLPQDDNQKAENGVDARRLIQHHDGASQNERDDIFAAQKRPGSAGSLRLVILFRQRLHFG